MEKLDISYKEIATIYGMPCARQPQHIAASEQIMAYMKYPVGKGESSTRDNLVYTSGLDREIHREHSKTYPSGRNFYSVKSLEETRLLRIMLIVGRKE